MAVKENKSDPSSYALLYSNIRTGLRQNMQLSALKKIVDTELEVF